MTEPTNTEGGIPPATSPVVGEGAITGTANNNESSAVCTMVSHDTDGARPINTSGSADPNVRLSLASDYMVVNRSMSSKPQQQGTAGGSGRQDQLDQRSPTSREVVIDMTELDPRGLPQTYVGVRYASPLSFDCVLPEACWANALIPWFTRAAIYEDAENDFNRLSLYAWDGQCY